MLRVTADTNIIVSGLNFPGNPANPSFSLLIFSKFCTAEDYDGGSLRPSSAAFNYTAKNSASSS